MSFWRHPHLLVFSRIATAAFTLALFPESAASAVERGNAEEGKRLASVWCASCHQIGPEYPAKPVGPPFMRLAGNLKYSRQYIGDWLTYPHSTMPNFYFRPEVVDNLVSYIHSLKPREDAVAVADPGLRFAAGTGFYVTAAGHLLTADHVLDRCRKITAEIPGRGRHGAELVDRDEGHDLALLKTAFQPGEYARFAYERAVEVGHRVVSFGYPLMGTLSSSGNLAVGYVSALEGHHDNANLLQISAELQFGNSGGPLLDTWGRIAGMATSKLAMMSAGGSLPQGVNFATKGQVLQRFLAGNGIAADMRPRRGEVLPHEIAALARSFTARVTCWR